MVVKCSLQPQVGPASQPFPEHALCVCGGGGGSSDWKEVSICPGKVSFPPSPLPPRSLEGSGAPESHLHKDTSPTQGWGSVELKPPQAKARAWDSALSAPTSHRDLSQIPRINRLTEVLSVLSSVFFKRLNIFKTWDISGKNSNSQCF